MQDLRPPTPPSVRPQVSMLMVSTTISGIAWYRLLFTTIFHSSSSAGSPPWCSSAGARHGYEKATSGSPFHFILQPSYIDEWHQHGDIRSRMLMIIMLTSSRTRSDPANKAHGFTQYPPYPSNQTTTLPVHQQEGRNPNGKHHLMGE